MCVYFLGFKSIQYSAVTSSLLLIGVPLEGLEGSGVFLLAQSRLVHYAKIRTKNY